MIALPTIEPGMAVFSLLWPAAQFLGITLAAFVILYFLARYLRFDAEAAERAHEFALLPRGRFLALVEEHLARRPRRPFCVVILHPAEALDEGRLEAWAGEIRRRLRRADSVGVFEGRIGLALDTEARRWPAILDRLTAALKALDPAAAFKNGSAAHPGDGKTSRALLARAIAALAEDPAPALPAPPPEPVLPLAAGERLSSGLRGMFSAARDRERPATLICLGLDAWKRISERHGADATATILAEWEGFLQASTRAGDVTGRLEEDTYLVMIPGEAEDGSALARRIVEGTTQRSFKTGSGAARLSISAGVAEYPMHGMGPGPVLDAARAALKAAQLRGGGGVLVFDPTLAPRRASAAPKAAAF